MLQVHFYFALELFTRSHKLPLWDLTRPGVMISGVFFPKRGDNDLTPGGEIDPDRPIETRARGVSSFTLKADKLFLLLSLFKLFVSWLTAVYLGPTDKAVILETLPAEVFLKLTNGESPDFFRYESTLFLEPIDHLIDPKLSPGPF